jgi:hypothetical protein
MFDSVHSYVENLSNIIKRQYPYLQIEIDMNDDALEIKFFNNQMKNRDIDFILVVDEEYISFLKTNFEFDNLFEVQYHNSFELKLFLINFFFMYVKTDKKNDFFGFISFIFGEKIESFLDYFEYVLKINSVSYEKILDNKIYVYEYGMIEQIAHDKIRVTNQHSISFRYINIGAENCTLFFSSVLLFVFPDLNEVKLFEDEDLMGSSEDNLDEDVGDMTPGFDNPGSENTENSPPEEGEGAAGEGVGSEEPLV